MSVYILGTSWDQCRSMVQYSFTSTETRKLLRTDSPGRPPRLSHSSWTMYHALAVTFHLSRLKIPCNRNRKRLSGITVPWWHKETPVVNDEDMVSHCQQFAFKCSPTARACTPRPSPTRIQTGTSQTGQPTPAASDISINGWYVIRFWTARCGVESNHRQ